MPAAPVVRTTSASPTTRAVASGSGVAAGTSCVAKRWLSAAQAASDEAAAAKASVQEVGAAVAGKANSADVQAIAADLAATKQATEANEKALADQIAALQKVATSKSAPKGDPKSPTPPGPGEYAVAKGDTLGSIAKKVGLSLKALQDLNPGVNPNRLQIGQKLKTK